MYRFVNALLDPYTLLLLVLFGVLFSSLRQRRAGRWLERVAFAMTGLLLVLSMPVVGYLSQGSLEWSYPPSSEVPSAADAIVVLSGNVQIDGMADAHLQLGDETLFRCWHAFQLYQRSGGCRIIVAGGRVPGTPANETLAEIMRDFFVSVGVPAAEVTLEEQSTTTHENARNTSNLISSLGCERIFLVTSAIHMRRAESCFARQNVNVIPCPCNHNALRLDPLPFSIIPSVSGIRLVQSAAHEWLGLLWYWVRDRV